MTSATSQYLALAQQFDEDDDLKNFRHRFDIDDPDLIYVDGNSLGRLPIETKTVIRELVEEEWGQRLIRGWNEGWYDLPERVGAKFGRLLGALPDEVIMADSTSVNLFKLVLAAAHLQSDRRKIVTDDLNFPSDLYILQSVVELLGNGFELVVVPSEDGIHGNVAGIAAAVDENTAVLTLSHTVYKSGYTYDMAAITEMAHKVGALTLWDTSHAIGALPIDLNLASADLAIGCSYKYLNGGPGSPAFLYVRRDLQEQLHNPISGWMGQKNPFEFGLIYEPIDGLRRFLSGTPPILSLAAAEPGIDLILEAGIEKIRSKSIRQSQFFLELWREKLSPLGFSLRSPQDHSRRGSHVTLGHPEGWRINRALIEEKQVIPDFRQPDNIRLGFAPLYNSYVDVYRAAESLTNVVELGIFEKFEEMKPEVT